MIFRRNGEECLFNKKKRIKKLEEDMEIQRERITCLINRVSELQRAHGVTIPSMVEPQYIRHSNQDGRNVTTNIYFDGGLLKDDVISQAEYEDRKYNIDIEDVTFHELAQYVLAGTPIHRERRTIVADPGENPQFHKSNILCTKSEGSDGLSDKRSEK